MGRSVWFICISSISLGGVGCYYGNVTIPPIELRADCIWLTNILDRTRNGLTAPEKLRYTKLRHVILKRESVGVTPEDIEWLRGAIDRTAVK